MNQEKIGKFISECRKRKNLTQEDLAEKLGVTNRSVSEWETGKCMPDLSLFMPLCDELEITINEFLSGEKMSKSEYQENLENNIINTIEYADKKIKENNSAFKETLIMIGIFTLLLSMVFFSLKTIFSFYIIFGSILIIIGFERFTRDIVAYINKFNNRIYIKNSKRIFSILLLIISVFTILIDMFMIDTGYLLVMGIILSLISFLSLGGWFKSIRNTVISICGFIIFLSLFIILDYFFIILNDHTPRFIIKTVKVGNTVLYDTLFCDVYKCNIKEDNEYYIIENNSKYDVQSIKNRCK